MSLQRKKALRARNRTAGSAVLIGVAVMLVLAKLMGEIFERLRQPAVLGELFAGILLGNLVIFGFTQAEVIKDERDSGGAREVPESLFCCSKSGSNPI